MWKRRPSFMVQTVDPDAWVEPQSLAVLVRRIVDRITGMRDKERADDEEHEDGGTGAAEKAENEGAHREAPSP